MSKIRTDLAMKEIKLNAPVMIKNLQSMLEKSLELECLNTRRLSNGPESRHGRIQRSPSGVADVVESRDGPDSSCSMTHIQTNGLCYASKSHWGLGRRGFPLRAFRWTLGSSIFRHRALF